MENETQILNSRYRLLELVGEGRTTVVHKALDLQLRRTVAVKILHPDLSTDAAFLSRFRNEARAAANILHPNIVAMHDFGTDGQTQYMVMEYVPGQDLKRKMQEQNPLGVEQALMLAIQICGGIGYAHRAGLVHADVKPQNILVTPEGIVKVSDFGINQALTDTQPSHRASIILGSPEYYSPEQVRGERPTPTSDVYAIGIIMFEMLAGRLPYIAANQQEMALAHIRAPIPLLSDLNPQVPEALARLVYRAMSKEPNERYTTADQLGNLLQVFREGKELPTDSVRVAKPPVVQGIPPLPPPPNPSTQYSTASQPPSVYRPDNIPNPYAALSPTSQTSDKTGEKEKLNDATTERRTGLLARFFKRSTKHYPRVFISYRRNTSSMLATLLSARLTAYDLTPYVDTLMPAGGPFPDRLVQAIRHSDTFVCLLADTTLESEWVRHEIGYANRFGKPMIPVFQESYKNLPSDLSDPAVKALLRNDGIHIFDVKNVYVDEAIERLAKMIKTLARKQH